MTEFTFLPFVFPNLILDFHFFHKVIGICSRCRLIDTDQREIRMVVMETPFTHFSRSIVAKRFVPGSFPTGMWTNVFVVVINTSSSMDIANIMNFLPHGMRSTSKTFHCRQQVIAPFTLDHGCVLMLCLFPFGMASVVTFGAIHFRTIVASPTYRSSTVLLLLFFGYLPPRCISCFNWFVL